MRHIRQVLKVRFEVRVEEPSLEALQRKEIWEYPLEALREAVINALIHRDYTVPGDVQVRIFEDRLKVWNPGGLPPPLTPERLREPHESIPRNPLLAQVFYYAGLIERWGTGTVRVLEACRAQGLPDPTFETFPNGTGAFRLTFLKDPYAPGRLRTLGLNERQILAIMYARERGRITNKDSRVITVVRGVQHRPLHGVPQPPEARDELREGAATTPITVKRRQESRHLLDDDEPRQHGLGEARISSSSGLRLSPRPPRFAACENGWHGGPPCRRSSRPGPSPSSPISAAGLTNRMSALMIRGHCQGRVKFPPRGG